MSDRVRLEPAKYKTTNWRHYNQALKARGALMIWLDRDLQWSGLACGKRGRPSLDPAARKLPVTIRLSPDVAEALRATGEGWQTRVDELLRIAMFPGRSTDEVRAPALSMFSIMTRNAGTGQFIRKAGKRSVKKRA